MGCATLRGVDEQWDLDPAVLGSWRSVRPAGALPHLAEVVDAVSPINEHEVLLEVDLLHVDATSFGQIARDRDGDPSAMAARISEIVAARGTLQNPVTGSGGVARGRVSAVGARSRAGRSRGRRGGGRWGPRPVVVPGVPTTTGPAARVPPRNRFGLNCFGCCDVPGGVPGRRPDCNQHGGPEQGDHGATGATAPGIMAKERHGLPDSRRLLRRRRCAGCGVFRKLTHPERPDPEPTTSHKRRLTASYGGTW